MKVEKWADMLCWRTRHEMMVLK